MAARAAGGGPGRSGATAGRADAQVEALTALLEGPLAELGLDLDAVDLTPAGGRRVLRVAVDQDGGVSLDEVAEATRLVSSLLDGSDVMGAQPYTLEVSSRGVDRPLVLPRHWRRNTDRLVKVQPHEGAAFTGRVRGSDDEAADLEVDGEVRRVAYAEVRRATVQVELNRKEA